MILIQIPDNPHVIAVGKYCAWLALVFGWVIAWVTSLVTGHISFNQNSSGQIISEISSNKTK